MFCPPCLLLILFDGEVDHNAAAAAAAAAADDDDGDGAAAAVVVDGDDLSGKPLGLHRPFIFGTETHTKCTLSF